MPIQNPISFIRMSISSDSYKNGKQVLIINLRVKYIIAIIACVSLVTNVCEFFLIFISEFFLLHHLLVHVPVPFYFPFECSSFACSMMTLCKRALNPLFNTYVTKFLSTVSLVLQLSLKKKKIIVGDLNWWELHGSSLIKCVQKIENNTP